MIYECVRCDGLSQGYVVPDNIESNEWEEIDADIVDTIIDSIRPVMKSIGRLSLIHVPELMREKLEKGEVVILTNFYVRKKVTNCGGK